MLLFYDEGSIFPPEISSGTTSSRKSYVQSWNGTAWDAPRPFVHVSEALTVGGEFWALTNGGYFVSKDGVSWSQMNPQPDWKEPFGCVLAGLPHVFYIDDGALRETSFDGMHWKEPHRIPGDWRDRHDSIPFPFSSGPQAAALSGRIHLFMLKRDSRNVQLLDMDDDAGVGSPRAIGPALSFRVLETPDGLHLFYKDMLASPQISTPSFSNVLSMASEMQSKMMRTSHRLYDGHAWSEPESIVTGQAMALSAAWTDDSLWLFGSETSFIGETVRRDGRWSPLKTVPGTSTAPSRSNPSYLQMVGVALISSAPMMLITGLFIWGVSASIESKNIVDLELPGGRVRCASLFRRAAAQFVDYLVLSAVGETIAFTLSRTVFADPATSMTTLAAGHFFAMWSAVMLAMLALYFVYFVGCEARWGQTPGKRLLGIRVINDGGAPCSVRSAAIRNVLRILDMFPAYLIGVLAFASGKKHQRVGDMAAQTLVVLDAKLS